MSTNPRITVMKHYQWKQMKWADEVFELSHWFIYPNANSVCEHLFVFVEETFLFRNISSYLRLVPRFRAAARSPAVTARLCYADNQRHLPVQSKDCFASWKNHWNFDSQFGIFIIVMREKSNKFKRGQGRKKSTVLKKDDISWLSKNTHFDPETVKDWHKVRIFYCNFNWQIYINIYIFYCNLSDKYI